MSTKEAVKTTARSHTKTDDALSLVGELEEHVLAEAGRGDVVRVEFGSQRQVDVATDELVQDLGVAVQAEEDELVVVEHHLELVDVPVDVP